jgi:hypothetical protein
MSTEHTEMFRVTKQHNLQAPTVHDFATEAEAEFAADAHYNTYRMRATVERIPGRQIELERRVASARALLEPLAEHDPAVRAWLAEAL